MNFTGAVKAAMQQANMRTPEVAKKAGISYQYLHDLLSGERRWNEETMNKVCEALNLQVTFEQKEAAANEEGAGSDQPISE